MMTPDDLARILAALFKALLWLTCYAVIFAMPLSPAKSILASTILTAMLLWQGYLDRKRSKP